MSPESTLNLQNHRVISERGCTNVEMLLPGSRCLIPIYDARPGFGGILAFVSARFETWGKDGHLVFRSVRDQRIDIGGGNIVEVGEGVCRILPETAPIIFEGLDLGWVFLYYLANAFMLRKTRMRV